MTIAAAEPADRGGLVRPPSLVEWGAPAAALAFVVGALVLAARTPLQLSLAAVVLFAGPHNFAEARYFFTHMPARWGPRRGFFITALVGWACLGAGSIASHMWGSELTDRLWMAALLVWVAVLVQQRSGRVALGLWGAAAVVPWVALPYDLVLVFGHPLLALVFLDRELRRRPRWRRGFRLLLLALPLLVVGLWHATTSTPPSVGALEMDDRVMWLAGAGLVETVDPQRLVAVYVFLQLLHYGAWIVALPSLRSCALERMPLARRHAWALRGLFAVAGSAVLALWVGFWLSPMTAWDVYFTVAIMHAVAELPLLVHKCSTR